MSDLSRIAEIREYLPYDGPVPKTDVRLLLNRIDDLEAKLKAIDAFISEFDKTDRLHARHRPGSIEQGRLEGERFVVGRVRAILEGE